MKQDKDASEIHLEPCICGAQADVWGASVRCDCCARGVSAADPLVAFGHWNTLMRTLRAETVAAAAPAEPIFRIGEVVDVSDNGEVWYHRFFIGDAGPEHNLRYLCAGVGKDGLVLMCAWRFCRRPKGKDGQ